MALSDDAVIATNRKARHNFDIEETLEAGIVLQGSEVKSLRKGRASLAEAYARIKNAEVFLEQFQIPIYEEASYQNHEPIRPRKLLLHASQILKLKSRVERDGYTIVPLKVYFKGNQVKVQIAVAKGRKRHDKRQALAKRDAERYMQKAAAARRKGQ
ncbi:MAG: SsrA-binding protein SmpB [Actinomycetota bacterium]